MENYPIIIPYTPSQTGALVSITVLKMEQPDLGEHCLLKPYSRFANSRAHG